MDRVILGENCCLEDGVGTFRPNNNQIVVGCSGTGKSMSVMLPTILQMRGSSMIGTYSKQGEALDICAYQRRQGYRVEICNLADPKESTVSFDPLRYVKSNLDVEELAASIVLANSNSANEKDSYWNDSAIVLLTALISATLSMEKNASMAKVLNVFDSLRITEDGRGIETSLDTAFRHLKQFKGNIPAVAAFEDFCQLPYSTAGCVRDTLAKALRRMFPPSVRELMQKGKSIDFQRLASKRTSLMIITSPVNTTLYFFANLLFSTGIKELLEFAEKCKGNRLPLPVRLMFDDFACAAKINNYSRHISIFRAAGLSAMMLIQSESQLRTLYPNSEATTLLDNCSAYVYFPGGMDIATCENIARKLDAPLSDVMFAPVGKVIVMQSGKKPMIVPRYNTLESKEYQEFLRISKQRRTARENAGGACALSC